MAMRRKFFRFSKKTPNSGHLRGWFEHFVRRGIPCYIAKEAESLYALYVQGEDAHGGESVVRRICPRGVVACFMPQETTLTGEQEE